MGQNAQPAALIDAATEFTVSDQTHQGWWWIGNATTDIYMRLCGPSPWMIYCALKRLARGESQKVVRHAALCELTGLSLPTIIKGLDILAAEPVNLIFATRHYGADGRQQPNTYTLLEPKLVGNGKVAARMQPVTTTPEAPQGDLWAMRPLDAALAELQAEGGNKLAVVARLYAMRFDSHSYPFDFARYGKLAKSVSGGYVALARFIWNCNPQAVNGNPVDYITKALMRAPIAPATPEVAKSALDDPQLTALRHLRETA